MTQEDAVLELLQHLRTIMAANNLLQQEPLPAEAFHTDAPFACDTMTFVQWLQFVFIPKMHGCCQHKTLPENMAIAAMAETVLVLNAENLPLLRVLQKLDNCISAGAPKNA
jgi:dTDP-4-dehydrorhamnose 3,5-epimerase